MARFSDEDRKKAQARLGELTAGIRDAWARRAEAPLELGRLVDALLSEPDLLLILGFDSDRALLKASLPELPEDELLEDAAIARTLTEAEVQRHGWAKCVALARLMQEGDIPRPEGDLGELVLTIPGEGGHAQRKRFADCTAEELERARAELARQRRKVPVPTPGPTLPTTPAAEPAPLTPVGVLIAVGLAAFVVGFAFGNSVPGVVLRMVGSGVALIGLIAGGEAAIGALAAFARRRAGLAGALIGWLLELVGKWRRTAIGLLVAGFIADGGTAWWQRSRSSLVPAEPPVQAELPIQPEPTRGPALAEAPVQPEIPVQAEPSRGPDAGRWIFQETFPGDSLSSEWQPTDAKSVKVENGSLLIEHGHNHPVWLTKPLPENAVIELDAWTDSPDGDLRVEVWGDGHSFEQNRPGMEYRPTGYLLVMGGARNARSFIGKESQQGPVSATRADLKVVPGRHYHWKILYGRGALAWLLDGMPFLAVTDTAPLTGPQHRYLGLSDWETPVHFANLRIAPLAGE